MIDILSCVQEFYILQLLDVEKKIDVFKKSNEKWANDLLKYNEKFERQFTAMLHDYLFLICGGEARHASVCCDHYISNIPIRGARDEAYEILQGFNPEKSIAKFINLFGSNWGGYSCGGELWLKIAESFAMFYSKSPVYSNAAIIDHCVDLSHNNGCAFNKIEANIFSVNNKFTYIAFLDHKKETNNLQMLLSPVFDFSISLRLISLLERGKVLGIISYENISTSNLDNFDYLWNYKPIKWGDLVAEEIKVNERFSEDGEEDEDDEHETFTCDCCENEFDDEDDLTRVDDGEHVCLSCLDNHYSYCESCGEYYLDIDFSTCEWRGNRVHDEHIHYDDASTVLCSSCYEKATICDYCGCYVKEKDAVILRGMGYCKSCFNDEFTECDICGEYVKCDDTFSFDGEKKEYCEACYKAEVEERETKKNQDTAA